MDVDADPVDLRSLGVDDRGISTEAILDADGHVTIQNADEDTIVLDQAQVQKLVAFLVSNMDVAVRQ